MSTYTERSAQAHGVTAKGFPMSPTSQVSSSSIMQRQTPRTIQNLSRVQEKSASSIAAAQEVEQTRLLADAVRLVQEHSFYMRQAMDTDDLPSVLDKAMSLLALLGDPNTHQHHHPNHTQQESHSTKRPSSLSAKHYYELHMRVCEELPNLEEYFLTFQSKKNGYSLSDLYEVVQYCPRVVPRTYLLICAAAAVLRSIKESKDPTLSTAFSVPFLLQELIDAVKCVQCPIRGLFIRYYLLQAMKDNLPDEPTTFNSNDLADDGEISVQDQSVNDGEEENFAGAKVHSAVIVSSNQNAVIPHKTKFTVTDSYEFVLCNFVEMNKLWVRIQFMSDDTTLSTQQHGSRRNQPAVDPKQARKKRERERNELRVLVGTNLVRLCQLEGISSTIYGNIILPRILEEIVACRDPLAQAYLMDCIIQVFPDEFHVQTLEIFLSVCPKLREKVNIRTILQSIMDRLVNYYSDGSLLNDEKDTDGVKVSVISDTFHMFDRCVRAVIEARGSSMPAKDIVRLEATLVKYSLKCFPDRMDQINHCFEQCIDGLQARSALSAALDENEDNLETPPNSRPSVDTQTVVEIENLLLIPLQCLGLNILQLTSFVDLLSFLPWENRRRVALGLVEAIQVSGKHLEVVSELELLLSMLAPLIHDEAITKPNSSAGEVEMMSSLRLADANDSRSLEFANNADSTIRSCQDEDLNMARLLHLIKNEDSDVWFDLLVVAINCIRKGDKQRQLAILPSLIYVALRLIANIAAIEFPFINESCKTKETANGESDETNPSREDYVKDLDQEKDKLCLRPSYTKFTKKVNCRKVFVFIQNNLSVLHSFNSIDSFNIYLNAATAADHCALRSFTNNGSRRDFPAVTYEFLSQALLIYEEVSDSKKQQIFLTSIIATLLLCHNCDAADYDVLSTKITQHAAKLLKKADQCKMILKCSHLFWNVDGQYSGKSQENPQRVLECLQRALKLADICISTDSSNIFLLVDVLDSYVYFFERQHPAITDKYVTGLIALIKEHSGSCGMEASESILHFKQVLAYIGRKKNDPTTSSYFACVKF